MPRLVPRPVNEPAQPQAMAGAPQALRAPAGRGPRRSPRAWSTAPTAAERPPRGPRSGGWRAALGALAALLAVLVLAGCGRSTDTTTGPAPVPGSTAAPRGTGQPTTSAPGDRGQSEPGAPGGSSPAPAPPTTCVRGPATTTPFDPGGGAITCSTVPDDGSVSSPPLTDTTLPGTGGPSTEVPLVPDAGHGVLRGSVGGSPCPVTAEQCVAMYRFVPATVAVNGPADARTHTAGMAEYQLLLPPGHYQVVATSDGPDDCTPAAADVVAGQVTDLSIDCHPRA